MPGNKGRWFLILLISQQHTTDENYWSAPKEDLLFQKIIYEKDLSSPRNTFSYL